MTLSNKSFHLGIYSVLSFMLLYVSSFQSSYNVDFSSRPTKRINPDWQSRTSLSPTEFQYHSHNSNRNIAVSLSNDNNSQKANTDYNDDAFGFIFLGGFVVTQDPLFAGTFLLFSAIAAIATRNGKLPATNAVPAAVAGFTLIVSLLLPKDQLYQLLTIQRPEPSLPVDASWIQVGFCTVSMLYGFLLSSSDEQ
mmetsp:Transcript_25187/g.59400  ORF Transcript_25187/g.59400 Transcript_25187/m.59400 type:complete len:194 (+) Transcript_25187:91-672(+)